MTGPFTRHQTTTLRPGRHRTPAEGVCAMELASMLAGEHFTDHPQCVCPVLAAFLRGYNDNLSAERRQDLFAIAAAVVGSRSRDSDLMDRRAAVLLELAHGAWAGRRRRLPWAPYFAPQRAFRHIEQAGHYVARAARRDRAVHGRAVAVIERLALEGRPEEALPPPATPPAPAAPAPV